MNTHKEPTKQFLKYLIDAGEYEFVPKDTIRFYTPESEAPLEPKEEKKHEGEVLETVEYPDISDWRSGLVNNPNPPSQIEEEKSFAEQLVGLWGEYMDYLDTEQQSGTIFSPDHWSFESFIRWVEAINKLTKEDK